jgi:mannan endo-1,4-beta-mannosidase
VTVSAVTAFRLASAHRPVTRVLAVAVPVGRRLPGRVRVTAGAAAIRGWTVSWTFANGQQVSQVWNATVTSSGAAVTARNVSYNGGLGAGASTNFGFIGAWNGTNSVPTPTCTAT